MTWLWLVLPLGMIAFAVWAGLRSRRHAGDYTLDQAHHAVNKYPGGGGGGLGG